MMLLAHSAEFVVLFNEHHDKGSQKIRYNLTNNQTVKILEGIVCQMLSHKLKTVFLHTNKVFKS